MQFVQPEVQKYLEAVYAVAPVPGEYVRYRLHLATALPLDLLDAWFDLRRKTSYYNQELNVNATGVGPLPGTEGERPKFSLFGSIPEEGNASGGVSRSEAAGHVDPQSLPLTLRGSSDASRLTRVDTPEEFPALLNKSDSSNSDGEALASSRFTEADLQVISSLVGLETLTSTQQHCGSTSLFLFEQLTALDSLEIDSKAGSKRRRTRHQHFWRNTDKLDARERVYIPTSSIRSAISRQEPVCPKLDISPDERTNAWTVCLTTQGVVSYLNKRISPLGVQIIRALQKNARAGRQHVKPHTGSPTGKEGPQGALNAADDARMAPVEAAASPNRDDHPVRAHSQETLPGDGQPSGREGNTQEAQTISLVNAKNEGEAWRGTVSSFRTVQPARQSPELIPRARRRKPSN